MTYREIARRLGLSHATVQAIEKQALAKMRAKLGVMLERKPAPTRCTAYQCSRCGKVGHNARGCRS